MKSRKLLIIVFTFIFVNLFVFSFNTKVNAIEISELIKVEGAQVRSSGNAGIRFVATETYEGENESYGILLAFGETTADDNFVVGGTVNGKTVANVEITADEEETFSATLYDIPEVYYGQKVSSRAYVKVNGAYVYSSTITIRSLADVVKSAYADGDRSEFVTTVYDKVKKNEIEITETDAAIISKYNPTKYVLSNASIGEYNINGTSFVFGTDIFSSLSAAIEGASENDVIYVFNGSFEENVTIDKALTIIGPNADKEGSAEDRVEEAVLSGVVTLSADNVTLKGLNFVGQAQLKSSNVRSNVTISNNYFSSTLSDANLILFDRTSGYYVDLTLSSNRFEQVDGATTGATNLIYISDIQNFTFTNNTFNNIYFKRALYIHDGAKGLSGLNNNLSNNTFNDLAGTAIYINFLSPNASTTTSIYDFNNNTFNNVPTGIYIADCNKNDKIAEFNICNNEFTNTDSCVEIHGIPGTISSPGIANMNIENNVFNTIPSVSYFNFEITGSYGNTFDGLYDVRNNDYVNEITEDQSDKFINVYVFENAYDYLVDDDYSSLTEGEVITLNNFIYTFGTNAFATISDALAVATNANTIYVASGTYNEDLTISNSITLKGANFNVLGNGTRNEETIIEGTVTLNADSITIEGFKFVGEANLVSVVGSSNYLTLKNNYFYTTIANNVIDFSVDTNSTYNYYSKPVFEGNKFEFVGTASGTGTGYIAFSDVDGIQLLNNEFSNLPFSALYIDDGSGAGLRDYLCDINMNNNTFNNIGASAIFVDYYYFMNNVNIKDNVFNNISGDCINLGKTGVSGYQGAATITITGNEFDGSNNNLIYIKKVVASMTVTATDNIFNAIPSGYYFTVETNAISIDVTNNTYFGDVTEAQADKFVNVEMTYVVKEITVVELSEADQAVINKYNPTMFVLNTTDTTKYTINGIEYLLGIQVFATLSEAVIASSANDIIYVFDGTHSNSLIIDKVLTILGPNADVNKGERVSEVLINGSITVSDGVSGFILNGFELSGDGYVTLTGNASNITIEYCKFAAHNQAGIVNASSSTSTVSNIKVNYNFSEAFESDNFVYVSGIANGFEAIGNDLTCTSCADVFRFQTTLKGTVLIKDNTVKTTSQSFVFALGVGVLDCTIDGNYLEDIASTCIDLRGMTENGVVVVKIYKNEFVNSGTGWAPIRVRTANYDTNDSIIVTVTDNKFIESYYSSTVPQFIENPSYTSGTGTFARIYGIGRNYYEVNGVAYTELTDDNFTKAAISFNTPYASEEEVLGFDGEEYVLPTSLTIDNKISQIGILSNYQIDYTLTSNATNATVGYKSSDTSVATVSLDGTINALSIGTCTITAFSLVDGSVNDSFTITVSSEERLEIRHDGTGVLEINGTLNLESTYCGSIYENENITYTSSDNGIATVDSTGSIKAVGAGEVTITASIGYLQATVNITVVEKVSELNELIQVLINGNNGVVLRKNVVHYGFNATTSPNFESTVYGSVNDYYAAAIPSITQKMMSSDAANYDGREMKSIEFIVFHDTADTRSYQNAKAIANWCTSSSNTSSSWHYSVGNDGIYQTIEDNMIAHHAGDGAYWSSTDSVTLYNTGIVADSNLRNRAKVTLGSNGYFYVNGQKSSVKMPTGATVSTGMNTLGIAAVVKDGYYYIPSTYIGPSDYNSVVCIRGGNYNGIGIESAVNKGSDVYLTWQYSAKLIAQLLVKHSLTPERVLFHNNFSNKTCPNTMLNADLIEIFLDLVYTEYEVLKNYSDYTITFTSHNPDIIDNTGRIISYPKLTTNVSYTITVSNGTETQSVTLSSLIIGQYN